MEEDLDNLYNQIEEVKEYVDRIPVKKKSFCKIVYAHKILTFVYSELIKFESAGKIKGVPRSKNFFDNIKGILNNEINIHDSSFIVFATQGYGKIKPKLH